MKSASAVFERTVRDKMWLDPQDHVSIW